MSQSILVNAGIALTSRIGTLALGLLATAWMTRIAGVESFGAYSLVATIGIFLQLLADFGLYLTASRRLGSIQGSGINEIISLRILFLFIVYALGGVCIFLLPYTRSSFPLFIVFAIGFSAQSISQLFMSVFQARGVVWRASVGDVVGRLAQLGVLGYAYMHPASFFSSSIGLGYALSIGLITALIIHVLLIPNRRHVIPRISMPEWKKLVITSFPIGALLVLNVIYFRIDTIMLAFFRSSAEVGWYALAYKIIEHTLFFPAMLGGLLLPHITASIKAGDAKRSVDLLNQAVLLSTSLALPIIAILILFSRPITLFVAGPGFLPSGPILLVLAWAAGIMFVGNILGFALVALKKQHELLLLYTVLVFFNIGANIVCIPLFGALGSAWVTVITEGIATSVASFLVYRSIRWEISSLYVGKLLTAFSMALVVGICIPYAWPLASKILIVCTAYGVVGYTTSIWSHSTISLLKTTKNI